MSRCPLTQHDTDVENDIEKEVRVCTIDGIYFSKEVLSLQDWKDAVKNDENLQKLIPLICNGWPREARLPECLRSFSKVKEELCWEDGLVLRGNL